MHSVFANIRDLSDDSDQGSEADENRRHSPTVESIEALPEPDEINDMEIDRSSLNLDIRCFQVNLVTH
jgi:hypothetical protein